jgi:tetratricopeptide (TPR) repeat protein
MAKKAMRRAPAAVAQRPAQPAERSAGLEDCRERLQSVELLLGSSRRDGLVLARALLDDAVIMLAAAHLPEEGRAGANLAAVMRALSGTPTRDHLMAAQRWLEGAEAPGSASADGIVALRRVVTDLTQVAGRADTTGLAALRGALRRITGLQASIGGAVVVAVLVAALLMLGGQDRRAVEFNALLAEGNARLAAGDHAGAVERFRGAIAAMPGKDRTADAWNDMGWSLQQLGRHEDAIAAYRKALELKPAFPMARNNLDAAQRQLDLKKSEKGRQQAPAGR